MEKEDATRSTIDTMPREEAGRVKREVDAIDAAVAIDQAHPHPVIVPAPPARAATRDVDDTVSAARR